MTTIPTTGQERRDAGIQAVLAADVAPHRMASPIIRASIEAFAGSRREFTAEDVRRALDTSADVVAALNDRPNLLPALFRNASADGLIETVGYTTSTRPARRASVLRIWQGVAA